MSIIGRFTETTYGLPTPEDQARDAVDAYLASPEAAEALARALGLTEVGCWANRPLHGPEQDDEAHARDAAAILAALRRAREALGS